MYRGTVRRKIMSRDQINGSGAPQTIQDLRTGETMNLVWHDEFEGNAFDATKWNFVDRMWDDRIVSTLNERNIKVENSNAVMQAWREDDGIYSTNITLTTWDRMSFRYGYMEIFAKVPFVPGAFPSFWFQSAHQHRTVNYMTEVDVFEPYFYNNIESTKHKWYMEPATPNAPTGRAYAHDWCDPNSYDFPDPENLSNEYHRYGFGWSPTEMYFSVDGQVYAVNDITDRGDFCEGYGRGKQLTGMEGFQNPLVVNFTNWLELNEGFRHKEYRVNDESEFPFTFAVDWIRLYQKPGEGELFFDRL